MKLETTAGSVEELTVDNINLIIIFSTVYKHQITDIIYRNLNRTAL